MQFPIPPYSSPFFAWWKAANSHFMPYKRWTPWPSYQSPLRETSWYEFEPIWSKLKLTSYLRCLGLHARTVHIIVSFRTQTPISLQSSILQHISFPFLVPQRYVLIRFGIKNHHASRDRTPFWICPSSLAYSRLCTTPKYKYTVTLNRPTCRGGGEKVFNPDLMEKLMSNKVSEWFLIEFCPQP